MKFFPATTLALMLPILLLQKMAAYIMLAVFIIVALLQMRQKGVGFVQLKEKFVTDVWPDWSTLLLLLLAFVSLGALSGLWSLDTQHWLIRSIEIYWFLSLFILALVLAEKSDETSYKFLIGAYILSVCIMLGILHFLNLPPKIENRPVLTFALVYWLVLGSIYILSVPRLHKIILYSLITILVLPMMPY